MQDKVILNRKGSNGIQSQENPLHLEVQIPITNQQAAGSTDERLNCGKRATEEAIDVLSFMGFKL